MGYRGRPGVYFNGKEFSYTFAENPLKDVDTVLLAYFAYRRFKRLRSKSGGSCRIQRLQREIWYELLEGTISADRIKGDLFRWL